MTSDVAGSIIAGKEVRTARAAGVVPVSMVVVVVPVPVVAVAVASAGEKDFL
jgi:hypothetical protein